MSDPINFCKNEGNCRDVSCPNATSDICLIAKEDLFHMFKTVTEVGLPQSPVSTNNLSSPAVKGICIDHGVQCFEKVGKGIYSSSNLPKITFNSVLVEEMTDNGSSEDFKPSSTNKGLGSFGKILEKNVGDGECSSPFKYVTTLNETNELVMNDLTSLIVNGYLTEHCYSGNAICEGGKIDTTEITADKILSETLTEQKSTLLQEFNTDFSQVDSSSHNDSFDENQDLRQNFDQVTEQDEKLTTMASPMQAKCRQNEETVWSIKDLLENTSSFPVTSADTKSNRIDNIKGASDDIKLHDGTFTSDLEAKDISNVDNESEVRNQQSVQTRIGTGTEELMIGGTPATQSLFAHFIHEDKNLPGAATLSGPITTSGHIPYSGNISHRSDSSTTSTHSFAFPILQPEWNSSPVKMAKADRKHLRKHRWRRALICCKF